MAEAAPAVAFPFHVCYPGTPLPSVSPAYLVGRGGYFMQFSTPCARVVVRTPTILHLAEVPQEGAWRMALVPHEETLQCIRFFRWAYEEHGTEAALILASNPATGAFAWVCPEQDVEAAHCHYDLLRTPIPEGFRTVGTIHSHASMEAHHSGTDIHDEASFDGMHLTVGRLDAKLVEIVASLKVGDVRFPYDPAAVLGGLTAATASDFTPCLVTDERIEHALDWIDREMPGRRAMYESTAGREKLRRQLERWEEQRAENARREALRSATRFSVLIPEGTKVKDFDPSAAWRKRVHARFVGAARFGSGSSPFLDDRLGYAVAGSMAPQVASGAPCNVVADEPAVDVPGVYTGTTKPSAIVGATPAAGVMRRTIGYRTHNAADDTDDWGAPGSRVHSDNRGRDRATPSIRPRGKRY